MKIRRLDAHYMSAMLANETASGATTHPHESINATDPNSWPECELRALEMTLEGGHIDRLEGMLEDNRTRRVLRLGISDYEMRVQAIRHGLAAARLREAAAGGPGSLVDPMHPLTIAFGKSAKLRAQVEARRAAYFQTEDV